METRSTWTDLIAGVGAEIAEVFDVGQEMYIPGLSKVVQSLTGEGGQEIYSGKTGAGELQKFNDGDNVPEGRRYKTYNTTAVWNNYGKYIDVTKNTIEDKDPQYKAALDEMKDLSMGANFSQDKSAMQLFNGGLATTIAVNGYDMTWYNDGKQAIAVYKFLKFRGTPKKDNPELSPEMGKCRDLMGNILKR